MRLRGSLDDGNSPMSRREIRALRREFAKLDRLGAGPHETLDHVPEQGSPASVPGPPRGASARDGATPAQPPGSSPSVGQALGSLRWSVLILLLLGVLMMMATVAPTGWHGSEPVPPASTPTAVPAAPLDPAAPSGWSDAPSSRFGTPTETPTVPEFTFRGPFGP